MSNSEFIKIESNQVFDCCDSSTMFVLDNGKEQFAVHLEIMLKCVKFAEQQGKIPPLPSEWWHQIANNFDELF